MGLNFVSSHELDYFWIYLTIGKRMIYNVRKFQQGGDAMHKAFSYRLRPTKTQAILIHKSIGCSRFVFNHFLGEWNKVYQEMGKGLTYTTCSRALTEKKRELTWLKEVDSTSLQNTLKHLADAFQRFFQKQNDAPRFKSRKNRVQTYTSQCNYSKNSRPTIEIEGNKIKLPKLGWVKFVLSREISGRILSATPGGKIQNLHPL
jgi:putative transposase